MNPIPRRIKQRPWAPTESLAYITPREGQFLRAHPDAPNAARLPDVGPLRRVNGIPAYWMGGADADAEASAQEAEDAGFGMGDGYGEFGDTAAGELGDPGVGAFGGAHSEADVDAFGADQMGAGVGLSGSMADDPGVPGSGGGWGADITGSFHSDPNMTAYDEASQYGALSQNQQAVSPLAAAMAKAAAQQNWGNLVVKDKDTARERAIRNRDKLRGRDLDPAVERAMWTDENDIVPFLSKLLGLTPFDRLRNMQMSPFDDPDGEWGGGEQLRNLPPKLVEKVINQGVTGPSGWVGSYEPGGQLVRTGQDEELMSKRPMPQGWEQELMMRQPSIARRNRQQFEDFGSPFGTIGSMIG